MNSEIPPIRESDNSNFDAESSDIRADISKEATSDETSDEIVDIWAEEEDLETNTLVKSVTAENFESEAIEFDPAPSEIYAEAENIESADAEPQPEAESASSDRQTELFVDSWLDEPKSDDADDADDVNSQLITAQDEIAILEQQKADLQREINELKAHKEQMLLGQVREVQENMGRMVEEGTKELKERKMALQIEIEKLERRQQRINQEMRSNFAGSSQELAVRVKGFKDYLVGSLQDLATAAEKLELATPTEPAPRRREPARSRDLRRDDRRVRRREESPRGSRDRSAYPEGNRSPQTQFTEPAFAAQNRLIRQLIDKYRNNPDYYGSPWQLRRTFEENQAQKVQDWLLVQGGRGAVDSMGSRLQNILVASAAISILHNLHGDRCRVLVLTDTPENLGEWRKGLEDCLGISRRDFGANRGVVLFDSPDVLVQRAERLISDKLLPIIIIDETEELLNLAILKFPIWLAFASTNRSAASSYSY